MGGGTRIPKVQQAIMTTTGRYKTSFVYNVYGFDFFILFFESFYVVTTTTILQPLFMYGVPS